jgi:hypothetical protein
MVVVADPTVFGYDGVKGDRNRCGPAGTVVRVGPTRVNVVDILHTRFWQTPHIQVDLYATFDVRECGRSAHPESRLGVSWSSALFVPLGQGAADQDQSRQ